MPLDFCINQTNRRQPKPGSQKGSMVWCCWIREEKQSLKQKHPSLATLWMSAPIITFLMVNFKNLWCTVMTIDPRWWPSLQAGSSSWETQKVHSSNHCLILHIKCQRLSNHKELTKQDCGLETYQVHGGCCESGGLAEALLQLVCCSAGTVSGRKPSYTSHSYQDVTALLGDDIFQFNIEQ